MARPTPTISAAFWRVTPLCNFLFGSSGTLDTLIGHRSILGHGLLEPGEGVADHVVFVDMAPDAYRVMDESFQVVR